MKLEMVRVVSAENRKAENLENGKSSENIKVRIDFYTLKSIGRDEIQSDVLLSAIEAQ